MADKLAMDITSVARSGLEGAQRTLDLAANRIANPDLNSDKLALLEVKNQFSANAQAIRTADDMQKRLIDLVG